MDKKHQHCWHNKGTVIRFCCYENTIEYKSSTTYEWCKAKHSNKFWESLFGRMLEI